MARSPHGRLDQEIRPPDQDFDEDKALALCAEIARNLLGDFSPALLLLPVYDRERVQTLLAYTFTLFDFARQKGVEGERLAQINRWQFTLESVLGGQPVGQPVFVRMAREHRRRAWSPEALDEIATCARRRATRPRPATAEEADAESERLARAVVTTLLGKAPPDEVSSFAGALVRLRALQGLGAEVAGKRIPLAVSELPDDFGPDGELRPSPANLIEAAQRECGRLRPRLMRSPRGLIDLPAGYRRAAVFCLLASLQLLTQIEDGDTGLLQTPPQLGVMSRIGLLARARFLG